MSVVIRKGTTEDLDGFITLLTDVYHSMDRKDWFYLDPPEVLREMMADGTMELWVAVDGGCLAGALSILHPGLKEYNYGYDLGFTEDQLLKVINMDSAAVHPDYRGQGLQRLLLHTAEQELQGSGERYLLCTIHPENQFSLNNALKQGYVIQKTLPKYGAVRHILRKNIF